jgi:hypothetical protein
MVVPGSSSRSHVEGTRRTVVALVLALGSLAVLTWWWWPGVVGDPDDIDVRLSIGEGLAVADQSIDRRLREEGFLLERTSTPEDWCEVADLIGQSPPDGSRIVVWATTSADCAIEDAVDRIMAAADDRRVVVVHLPTDDPDVRDSFVRRGAAIVDTARLLGEPGASLDCLWWEDCPESGSIEPWIDDDRLSAVGGERVARMIVTATL